MMTAHKVEGVNELYEHLSRRNDAGEHPTMPGLDVTGQAFVAYLFEPDAAEVGVVLDDPYGAGMSPPKGYEDACCDECGRWPRLMATDVLRFPAIVFELAGGEW